MFVFALAMTYVALAAATHTSHRKNFPAKQFTKNISELYREQTGKPLEIMGGSVWTAGMFRHYAPGHPQSCILKNRSELERLGPLLKEHGGLIVSDKEEDIRLAVKHFDRMDTFHMTYDVESRSMFGKKRTRTIYLTFLTGATTK